MLVLLAFRRSFFFPFGLFEIVLWSWFCDLSCKGSLTSWILWSLCKAMRARLFQAPLVLVCVFEVPVPMCVDFMLCVVTVCKFPTAVVSLFGNGDGGEGLAWWLDDLTNDGGGR